MKNELVYTHQNVQISLKTSMGFKSSYFCPICNYEVFTSGGPDRGFTLWTNTFVCLDCKTVADLVIKNNEFKSNQQNESELEKSLDDHICKKCGGKNFEIWDNKKKPCPKCGTSMKQNPNGSIMLWD